VFRHPSTVYAALFLPACVLTWFGTRGPGSRMAPTSSSSLAVLRHAIDHLGNGS
jgi:hypothetical protein